MTRLPNICLLGFGEVGSTLADNLGDCSATLKAYDPLFTDPSSVPSQAAQQMPVVVSSSPGEAALDCQLVVSAVTADQCIAAAESVAEAIDIGTWYLDLNSVSPGTKRRAAAIIEAGKGRYVEAAVMSPIRPLGIAAPMLLGGPHAAAFLTEAAGLGFDGARVFAAAVGQASAAKMCRSVVIKGIEALLTESLLPARRYGVDAEVLDSLQDLLPGVDWQEHARYMIGRTLVHGTRRAEEMREVAATLTEVGVEPLMSSACAARQAIAPRCAAAAAEAGLAEMLDRMLSLSQQENAREEETDAHH